MIELLANKPKARNFKITRKETLVEVYGNTEGSITGANRVIIAPTGCCKSSIKADHLEIAGEVFGDVDVEELVIRRAGCVHGQVKYKKITLLEGAVFCLGDQEEKTETISAESVSELQAVVGLHLVSSERQLPKAPLNRQITARQVNKIPEQEKKVYPDSAPEKEHQEPCFTTSF